MVFLFLRKNFEKLNTNLFCNYSIISSLFRQFGLVIEYDKSEVFYFSRVIKNLIPSLLNLRPLGGVVLRPKDTW